MNSSVSRRGFIQAAGATAGFAIAAGYSPLSYAQNDKVRVGCIGTGGQGTFHIRDGLKGTPDILITAVCDVFTPHQRESVKYAQISNSGHTPQAYYDYREMLEKEDLDAVVIATPLKTHFPITMDCLDAGKYVFCEKTLVDNFEDGRTLITKCHDLNRWVQVGHQRRYNPKYNMAMGFTYDNSSIGRITHLTAQWHRNHYWRRVIPSDYQFSDIEKKYIKTDLEHHLNWRIYQETSLGLFTELATHQTDVANWFMKKLPARVHTFAGLDYWRDGRTVDDNILLTYEYDQKPGDPGFIPIDARSTFQKMNQINRAYTVRFSYSSILANAKRGASELIQGDRGSFELTEKECRMYGEDVVVQTGEEESIIVDIGGTRYPKGTLFEGIELLSDIVLETADVYQFRAFADCIRNGSVPRSNQMVGFTTAITAIAAVQSRNEGRIVEIDPAVHTFDFPVPSFYDYDPWDEEDEKNAQKIKV